MKNEDKKVVQVSLTPKEHAAGKMRASQRDMSLSMHVGDVLTEDAKRHHIWQLVQQNREEACGD